MSKLSFKKREVFLSELATGQSVSAAAHRIGVTRQALYKLRGNDAEFSAAWEDAYESGTDNLEDEAVKRAKDSSDTLLIFLLKGRRPDKYRERFTIDVNKLDADIERELAIITAGSQTSITGEAESETIN